MTKKNTDLKDVVVHSKLTQCSTCDSHEYILPFPLTPDVGNFINCLGPLKYPLSKVKVVKIENLYVHLMGRVGQNKLRVKFKKDPSQRKLFEMQLAAYIGKELNTDINHTGLLN